MVTPSITDLRDFHRFVGDKVNNGGASLSREEVLDKWRTCHPDPAAITQNMAAIQDAIDDIENGDTGVPFEEFDRGFRARHGLFTP